MEKMFRLVGLDCANCAAKMERKVNKIKGVEYATVDFMSTKLLLEAKEITENMQEDIQKAVQKVDRHVVLQTI
ncbi:MAG: cation transporter [Eubacteriales bacterium]